MKDIDLELIGWTTHWERHFAAYVEQHSQEVRRFDSIMPGRVVSVHHDLFHIQSQSGIRLCTPSGSFRQQELVWPAVGDWAVLQPVDKDGGILIDLLPRAAALQRGAAGKSTKEQVLAANIDYVFIVCGLDNDFNLRRIERYLTIAWNSGAIPAVVLNKADLVENYSDYIQQTEASAPGVDVLAISALTGEGVDAMRAYLQPGITAVLVGSSGSGKSTLTNALIGNQLQTTREVRDNDNRGRHTTTSRNLLAVSSGGALIDTPGLREVELWGETDSLSGSFVDIIALAKQCRFNDCSHQHEPGCAVLEAVEKGELSQARIEAYRKQLRELEFIEDKKAAQQRKKDWHKSVSKQIRKFYK